MKARREKNFTHLTPSSLTEEVSSNYFLMPPIKSKICQKQNKTLLTNLQNQGKQPTQKISANPASKTELTKFLLIIAALYHFTFVTAVGADVQNPPTGALIHHKKNLAPFTIKHSPESFLQENSLLNLMTPIKTKITIESEISNLQIESRMSLLNLQMAPFRGVQSPDQEIAIIRLIKSQGFNGTLSEFLASLGNNQINNKECTESSLNMNQTLLNCGRDCFKEFLPRTDLVANAMNKFQENCMAIDANLKENLRSRLGTILFSPHTRPPRPICTGFAISPRIILTARHCFFNTSTGRSLLLEHFGTIEFQSFSGEKTAAFVSSKDRLTSANEEIETINDYILLDTDRPLSVEGKVIPASAKSLQKLWIGSRRNVYSTSSVEGSQLQHSVYGACAMLGDPGEGCIVHACNTLPTMSGAPLLSFNDKDEILLHGIHSGTTGKGSCEISTSQLNTAVDISVITSNSRFSLSDT